jgi:transketolase
VRAALAETLLELAEEDERIVLLTGDLGFTVWEPFAERFPDRFYNVGVAEQNMVGLATGLAEAGRIPFVYSIATFATLRPYEFIRNGPVVHDLPVRVVGVGGGFDYGLNGVSHYALEDVGAMRMQPGMTVVVPADPAQTRTALRAAYDLPGPVYLRVGKQSKSLEELSGAFRLGHIETIGHGEDVAFIALGTLAREAVEAAAALADEGVNATTAVVAAVEPAPVEDLVGLLSRVPVAITAEAHYLPGGLGSLVCEIVAERGLPCRVLRCGVSEVPRGDVGSREHLHDRHGLSAPRLASTALQALSLSGS